MNNFEALDVFLEHLRKVPSLTKAETDQLFKEVVENKCIEAKKLLMKHNLRLVVFVAKKNRVNPGELIDKIQDGVVGLSRAIDTFNPDYGTTFSTYASTCIRHEIQEEQINRNNHIRIPLEALRQKGIVNKTMDKYKTLTKKELVDYTGFSEITLERLMSIPSQPLSTEQASKKVKATPGDENEFDMTLGGTLKDKSIKGMEEQIAEDELLSNLDKALAKLKHAERSVLIMMYGLYNIPPVSRQEIADMYGVSRQRIHQIELAAIAKLKNSPYKDCLRGLL